MRNFNGIALSGQENQSINGTQFDSNQWVSASFHAFFGDAQGTGTFKLQVSNDTGAQGSGYAAAQDSYAATNWVDIPSQTAAVTTGTSAILTVPNMSYRWIRAVWAATGLGIQTIVVHADVSGSLNSKYFLLNSANAGTGYYVWFNVNSAGVDPMIAGRTGVPVALATNDSAATVGTALTAAIDGLANFIATGTTTVTVTNSASGPFTPITDGAAPTGFTFTVTGGGGSTITINCNALSI